jgi:hypothetical protein
MYNNTCHYHYFYKKLINIRLKNKRTNLGKIYLDIIYIINISNINVKNTWLRKKKGTNCGIWFFLFCFWHICHYINIFILNIYIYKVYR